MKVTTINYQKVFPLGQYINERIGVEIQVDADDNENECLRQAKLMVERFHKENNPQLYQEQGQYYNTPQSIKDETGIERDKFQFGLSDTYNKPILPTENLTQEQKINNLITQATSIKELEQWKLLSSNSKYPSLREAYQLKLEQLTNNI